jgi:DNA polymerase-1
MPRYVFDVEADGFLEDATRIHCLVLQDIDTGEVFSCAADRNGEEPGGEYSQIGLGLKRLSEAALIVGHNAIKFDIPLLQKLYPNFKPTGKVRDTLVMARLIHSNIDDSDAILHRQKKLPGKLYGSHSLEAWGYRLDHPKIGLDIEDWSKWTPNMQDRCVNDVKLTRKLWHKLTAVPYSEPCLELEHEVAILCAKMERNGFPFDSVKAVDLYSTLCHKRNALHTKLIDLFPAWWAEDGEFTPKKDSERLNYSAGCVLTKVKLVEFNPGSRHHIANRLKVKYGWRPNEFTPKGEPKVDEGILKALPYPEAQALSEFMLVQKRIGQIGEGDQSWLKLVKDGRIHGSINTCGAVTGRATHSNPNIAQVPRVGSPYGKECRELFKVPEGWVLVGSDQSGIELRGLAHYLGAYDGGAYVDTVLNGDPHTRHQQAAGLDTRNQAKTFGYAYLYGAGDQKLGSIVDPTASPKKAKLIGKERRARFQSQLTGLDKLQNDIRTAAGKRGYLKGLDGRKLHVRSDHAALNTLLQSFGAVVAKEWIVGIDRKLSQKGLSHGWDGDYAFCAWVHDEVQIAARAEIAEKVAEVCIEAAKHAGEHFNLRIRIDAEAKIGNNWAETH